ncbi:MAG: hypothetical protein PHN79_02530 [Methanoregula sp.]|nr:hypothetical protein [Methanoregula sp.]
MGASTMICTVQDSGRGEILLPVVFEPECIRTLAPLSRPLMGYPW